MHFYITGDTHGRFERIEAFFRRFQTSYDDILIILGDAYRVEYLASGAERHGDIYDAQHARHATRKGGDAAPDNYR